MLPFKLQYYWKKHRPQLQRLTRALTLRRVLLCLAAALLVVGGVVFLRARRKPSAGTASFADLGEIVVGIAAPSTFAAVDDAGEVTGFERDVAAAVLSDLYPDKAVSFRAISSQEASYLLKTGQIHIALGMYVSGPLKTQGLSLSNAYFTDGVYAFCPAESTADSLWALTNQRVRVLSSDITKSAVASMFKKLEIAVDLHLCSSYPDGIASLSRGDCAALIAPRYKLASFAELRRIEEPVGFASYRFLLWSDNADVTALINTSLSRLRASGRLAELRNTWGLLEYTAS